MKNPNDFLTSNVTQGQLLNETQGIRFLIKALSPEITVDNFDQLPSSAPIGEFGRVREATGIFGAIVAPFRKPPGLYIKQASGWEKTADFQRVIDELATKLNKDGNGLNGDERIDLNLNLKGVPVVNADELPTDTTKPTQSAVGTVYILKNTGIVNGTEYKAGSVVKIASNTNGVITLEVIGYSKEEADEEFADKFSKSTAGQISSLSSKNPADGDSFLLNDSQDGQKVKRSTLLGIWNNIKTQIGKGSGNLSKIILGNYSGFSGVMFTARLATADADGQYLYLQNPTDGSVISMNKYGLIGAVDLRLADMASSAKAFVPLIYGGSNYSNLNNINQVGEYVLNNAQSILNKPTALPTNISNLYLKVIRQSPTNSTNLTQRLTHLPSLFSNLTYGEYERRQTGQGTWTAWTDITNNAYEVGYSIIYTTQSYTLNPVPNGKRWLTGWFSLGGQTSATFKIRADITSQYAFDKIPSGYFETPWTRFVCCNVSYNASTRSISFTSAGFKEVQTSGQPWYNQMGNNQWSISSLRYE